LGVVNEYFSDEICILVSQKKEHGSHNDRSNCVCDLQGDLNICIKTTIAAAFSWLENVKSEIKKGDCVFADLNP